MRYCSRTHVGKVRDKNEDVLYANERLFAVADGMGGHRGGEIASATAIRMLSDAVGAAPGEANAARLLAGAIVSANEEIYQSAHTGSGPSGMGTTLTAAMLGGDVLTIGHVGDSRAYLLRDGNLTQLTEDHSLVGELYRSGKLSQEEAFAHPNRNVLTKALGTSEDITADVGTHKLRPGDKVLLTTDGLTTMVPDEGIARILAGPEAADEICAKLVDAANRAGGADNISVVLLDFSDDEPFAARQPIGSKPRKTRKGGCGRTLALILLPVALLALLGAVGVYQVVANTYYVGVADGDQVTIFRGVPGSFMGLRYSQEYEQTSLVLHALTPRARQQVVDNEIVGDLTEVRETASRLEQVEIPETKPLPPGHPPTGPSTEPTATEQTI